MSAAETLALLGGPKVKTTPYGKGVKHDAEAEIEALRRRFLAGPLPLAKGQAIMEFRQRVQELFGVRYCVPCSSGSAAVHAGLAALGVGPGDEVVTTPLTDHGTLIGIMQLNAIPVFADVNPATLMIDADTIAPRLSSRTRALLPVHNLGCPTDMTGIMALAGRHGLRVLEDCAQSWMAEWDHRLVGTFGHVGIYSANESKHISAGEGGVILTNEEDLGRYADLFVDKSYNRTGVGPVDPVMPALNYRMSELNAVIGVEQLKKVRAVGDRRHALGERLAAGMAGLPGVSLLRPPAHSKSSYWGAVLFVDATAAGVDGTGFAKALAAEGISAGQPVQGFVLQWPLFRTLNENPTAFRTYIPPGLTKGRFEPSQCPNAQGMRTRAVRLHLDNFCTDQDIDETIWRVRKSGGHYCQQGQG